MYSSSKTEEKARFTKNLFEFLQSRNVSNLKVPHIGGKELDLHELYHAVIRRGGAETVCAKKLWKEIVNEFNLPASCTSASFTLKNHYEKYLLSYEQKFHFGKNEEDMVKVLANVRQRRTKPVDNWRSSINLNKVYNNDSNLKYNLFKTYAAGNNYQRGDKITYIRRAKMIPFTGEMRRIMLAFESHLQDEIRFSLNHLLMYSCSKVSPIMLENYEMIFIGMMNYLEYISRNNPYLFKGNSPCNVNHKGELNVLDNYNFEICDLMKGGSERTPIDMIKDDKKFKVTMKYEEVSHFEIFEQITRNLAYIPGNDRFIFDQEEATSILFDFFFRCMDAEISRNSLEIISILCKHIILRRLPKEKAEMLTARIIQFLDSDNQEEYEAALQCLHNLMLSQENEMTIEDLLPQFLNSIVRLLMSSSFEAIASTLEILCYLSDLKMNTRLLLAKQPNMIPRLIALIAGNFNDITEKNAKLSAMIISNICITHSAKKYFLAYEKDLFCLASCDDTVSEILSGVLQELEDIEVDPLEVSEQFYMDMELHMGNIEQKFK